MKNQNITFTAVVLALCALAFLPQMLAVSPAPDGCYPGLTTAEGCNALFSVTSGHGNTALGHDALFTDTEGSWNTAVGAVALGLNNGDFNTAVGTAALLLNTTGPQNTAIGAGALVSNNTGEGNTATGAFALYSNTEGDFNTANGEYALYFNATGERNTAIGDSALYSNTLGNRNTAVGNTALLNNSFAGDNTAVGAFALFASNANWNTAVGSRALQATTAGTGNTAIGFAVLGDNTTGYGNTGIGFGTLQSSTGSTNTAVGATALGNNTSGTSNIALGVNAGLAVTTASNVLCIGANGANVDSSCYIANIWQQPGGSQAVYVSADGKLGAQVSSRRFKRDIKPMEQSSEVIYQLNPVNFRYNPEIESNGLPGFGLIAEDVDAVTPDLVLRDKEGKPYTVRYDQINAMLLNEFLKEHRKNEEQGATITALRANDAKQEATIASLQKQIETLTAGLQKVSAQLE
jgi:hypothetical protein